MKKIRITAQNDNDIKLEPQRVLQPSKTALQNGRAATITLSSFMSNNISQKSSEFFECLDIDRNSIPTIFLFKPQTKAFQHTRPL